MALCNYCHEKIGIWERFTSGRVDRCKACTARFEQHVHNWLARVNEEYIQGGIPSRSEQAIMGEINRLMVPPDLSQPVIERLRYLRFFSEVRWGNVPVIHTNIHLDTDEYAHFDMSATYCKANKRVEEIPGRLVGTNKKCYFLTTSGSGGMTIDWNNVSLVEEKSFQFYKQYGSSRLPTYRKTIHLTVSKGSGGGHYVVADPYGTKVLIDALVRLWKRQLVLTRENATKGPVPEHVKAAVYKRDGGKCVQCGYMGEYIEYDHVIPRSKGGPNTVQNIQLLCRRCNLLKSDRV